MKKIRGFSNRLRTLISYTDIGISRGVITKSAERLGVKESTFRNWYKNDAYPSPTEMLRIVNILLQSVPGQHKASTVTAWIYFGGDPAMKNPFSSKEFKALQYKILESEQ